MGGRSGRVATATSAVLLAFVVASAGHAAAVASSTVPPDPTITVRIPGSGSGNGSNPGSNPGTNPGGAIPPNPASEAVELTLTPDRAQRGDSVNATARGFTPGENVRLVWYPGASELGVFAASSEGALSATFIVGNDARFGGNTIEATGATSGLVANGILAVFGSAPPPTGVPGWWWLAGSAALLVLLLLVAGLRAGWWFFLLGRRGGDSEEAA